CVGEGGSGGALALAHADRLLIQEHAVFSVIAPEGAAAILERDAAKAPELASRLKLTSADLLQLGIVDGVVHEPDPAGMRLAVVAAATRQTVLASSATRPRSTRAATSSPTTTRPSLELTGKAGSSPDGAAPHVGATATGRRPASGQTGGADRLGSDLQLGTSG